MGSLKIHVLYLALAPLLLSGCQVSYLVTSAYNQMKLLGSRVPIEKALLDPQLSPEEKNKLELAQEVRQFAEKNLHLVISKNYDSYVHLDRPYVTYVVSAAPKWDLRHHQWAYPFVGKMPYKGYFNENDAKDEEESLRKQDLDTYLRGVSAYSTLGWFNDPLLSSMLRYSDYDLVNTIIHETVHATLYIKHAADFNERLASFLGAKGAELYYLQKEGPESETLKQVQNENKDDEVFSSFISSEIKDLTQWYKKLPTSDRLEQTRSQRLVQIQDKFSREVLPKMLTDKYHRFPNLKLNNARLLIYKTYMSDWSDFDQLYELANKDFARFLEECKALEGTKDPEQALKDLIAKKKALTAANTPTQ